MLRRWLLLLAALFAAAVTPGQALEASAQSPIPAGPPLTGHAAQDSPPARAFAALLQVVSKGDFPSIRADERSPRVGHAQPGRVAAHQGRAVAQRRRPGRGDGDIG